MFQQSKHFDEIYKTDNPFHCKSKSLANLAECRVSSEQYTSRTVRKFRSTTNRFTSTHSNFRKNVVPKQALK